MKKGLCLWLCSILMVALFCGCEEEVPEPTLPPRQVVEVPYETQPDSRPYVGVTLQYLSALAETDPQAAVLRQAAEAFEMRTGAKVEFLWLPDTGNTVSDYLSEQEGVDIFEASLDQLAGSLRDTALDLTELAGGAGYETCSYAVLRQQVLDRCGSLQGIVYRPVLYGMYYNLDAFEFSDITYIPESWEEYLTVCRKLIQGGYVPLTMDVEKSHLALELHMERSLGYGHLEQLMHEGGWRQDENALELIRRIVEFVDTGFLPKWTPAAFPGGQNKLTLSNAAMAAGSNLLCSQVEEDTAMDLNWGVFAYPGTGEGAGLFVDSDVLAIHKECPDDQAAFDFVMLLTTGEFDQLRADVSLGIPADPRNTSRIAGAGDCLEKAQPRSPGLMDAADCETYSRIWSGWYKVDTYFANALNQIAYRWVPEETKTGSVG